VSYVQLFAEPKHEPHLGEANQVALG